MSNAAKNEVLSSFGETINNSLAEMDHKKLKHLFTPFLRVVKGGYRSRFTKNKSALSQLTKNDNGISRFTKKKSENKFSDYSATVKIASV